jgi:hypothetical protein
MYMLIENRHPDTFTEDEVKFYASELVLAMSFLHLQVSHPCNTVATPL